MTATEQWVERSDRVIMKTYGRYPIVPVRGEGCRVWDADGNEYLDFLAGVAVNNLGHCHPRVVKAIQDQAASLIHCSNYYQIPQQIELAELLCSHSFADRAFFCNSGAEANEAAIKLARKYSRDTYGPERFEIITAADSFHGRTMATVSATGQEKVQRFFDPLLHGFKHVPFNDVAAIEAAITPTTCAVMLEPIQGEGGINVPDRDYLAKVRELCDRHKLILILDEVQTGIGRTGKLFAYQHFGITPDIMTLAKALAGGAPIGTMLAREEIAAAFVPGTHGSTFGGNPFDGCRCHCHPADDPGRGAAESLRGDWRVSAGRVGGIGQELLLCQGCARYRSDDRHGPDYSGRRYRQAGTWQGIAPERDPRDGFAFCPRADRDQAGD